VVYELPMVNTSFVPWSTMCSRVPKHERPAFTIKSYCARSWEKGKVAVLKVIERVQAHYEVQDVEMGKVYRWHPKSVLIECECGEMVTLTDSKTSCEACGAEHIGLVREDLTARKLDDDEDVHPWRYSEERNGATIPF
jgi:hypothetical protein